MENVVAVQVSQVKPAFGQMGGAVGKSSGEGMKFSDLLQVLSDAQEQGSEKDADGLDNTCLGSLLSNLINTLPAEVYAEFGCGLGLEQQSIAGDQLAAALEDLAGMLDDAKTGQGVPNGDEAVQALISLLVAGTPGTETPGTGAIPPAGAAAGTQHRGSLLAGELPVIPADVNTAPFIDVAIGDPAFQVKGGVSDAAPQIKVNSASISGDAASLVAGEAVSENAAASLVLSEPQPSVGEAAQENAGLPENFHLDTLPEQKLHQNSSQVSKELSQQEIKQAEFKNPGPVLLDDGATTSSASSAPIQANAPHSFEINSTRAAPGVERAVLEQVMQAIESTSLTTDKSKSMLSISLKPEYLGNLKLVISVENGIVNAHFLAQNQLTANLIDSQLPELKQSLSQQGISWQQVTVSLESGGSGTQSQQGMYQRQDGNVHFAAGEDDFLDQTYPFSGPGIVNYVV